jgi:phosphoglycerate dehydrogenase-like enzyme
MPHEVFVLDSAQIPHASEVDIESEILRDCASVHLLHLESEADFGPYLNRAAGLIIWHQLNLTAECIRKLKRAQIIVRNGVGFENVDTQTAAEMGIPVCNVPDYGTEEVADHTLALCLALARQLRPLLEDVRQGNWRWEVASACRRIRGRVFGIIGCGRIGTATALRAKAFGYAVRFYDPYVSSGYEKALGLDREHSLEQLLADSDVVSLHVPLTAETQHMIDVPQLQIMKPAAFLINTARGPVVRRQALEQAFTHKWIAGAALDVLEDEPLGMELSTRFESCLITSHCAFYSQESMIEMRRTSAQVIREALCHKRLMNVVNGVQMPVGA